MKIQPFNATIETLKYIEIKKENQPEPKYSCYIGFKEVSKGNPKSKPTHHAWIELSKEEFNNKALEQSDIIAIREAKWNLNPVVYTSYSPKVLQTKNKSELKVDKDGKAYYSTKLNNYVVNVKRDQWKILHKWYDVCYLVIADTNIKLPLLAKKQFKDEEIDFILEVDEFETLKPYNATLQKVTAFYKGVKFSNDDRNIFVKMDENENLTLRIVKQEKSKKREKHE